MTALEVYDLLKLSQHFGIFPYFRVCSIHLFMHLSLHCFIFKLNPMKFHICVDKEPFYLCIGLIFTKWCYIRCIHFKDITTIQVSNSFYFILLCHPVFYMVPIVTRHRKMVKTALSLWFSVGYLDCFQCLLLAGKNKMKKSSSLGWKQHNDSHQPYDENNKLKMQPDLTRLSQYFL